MPLPRAVLTLNLAPEALERLAPECEVVVRAGVSPDEVYEALADAEGILGSALFPITTELLDRAPRLRVVSNFGVGYNNVDVDELTARGIAICNTPGVLSGAVADITMGLILMATRRLIENVDHVRSGGWSARKPVPPVGFDIEGKTLGLVGYGRIGQAVAHRARAFGMRIVFYDVFTTPPPGDNATFLPLDELLTTADIVSIHTNLTAETTHMISKREFGLMKNTAWIVNTARGPVIDEAAMVEALHAGQIAGAALDVVEVEPPPIDAPILSAPNTIILPHAGSASRETRQAMLELCVENLADVLSGRVPRACVNPEVLDRALQRR